VDGEIVYDAGVLRGDRDAGHGNDRDDRDDKDDRKRSGR
jgi:hypothetical protein